MVCFVFLKGNIVTVIKFVFNKTVTRQNPYVNGKVCLRQKYSYNKQSKTILTTWRKVQMAAAAVEGVICQRGVAGRMSRAYH